MKPALLLVDLQRDHLAAPGLEPAPEELVRRAANLLRACRALSVPVLHVWTTCSREADDRMPHWRDAGRWACVAGTEGHESPAALRPEGEPVIEKRWFSGFSSPQLDTRLRELGAEELILCGVHLHGCVRTTALDAYQRGYRVWVADDAVGSYDGVHAAVTRHYLEGRAARFASVDSLVLRLRGDAGAGDGAEPSAASGAASTAAAAGRSWRLRPVEARTDLLSRAASAVEEAAPELADRIVAEIGKPLLYARAEVARGVALLRLAARLPDPSPDRLDEATVRRVPLGTVAQITPFNNPVGVPLGKLAAALRHGNSVVWKPSPMAPGVAERIVGLLEKAACPPGLVSLLQGGAETAAALMADPAVDAVSLTGSSQAGFAAQSICGGRRIPVQAELGGNNAAIVWRDSDLDAAAAAVAEAGFGAAGQRCTANRRVIVDDACHADFVRQLEAATASLELGEPSDPRVRVGPLVSDEARDRVTAIVERARAEFEVSEPVADAEPARRLRGEGAYHAPTLVLCDDPGAEIVQEESFGPVVVVQRAAGIEQALELLNGVRQGLVASLFSRSPELRELFLREARAGVLKLDLATADAGVEVPFGGWKASGVGPPEHGDGNREFYTRAQAVYSAQRSRTNRRRRLSSGRTV
jgi:acyl-CoA reductase-like NAD-dependent aldehyde dehydrogenase/nicotinamidase-related amidase